MEREKVIELFLGLILTILVVIMIFSFTNISSSKTQTTTTISNSYNTYTYNTYSNYPATTYKPIKTYNAYNDYPAGTYGQLIYHDDKRYSTKDYNYLRYTSTGNHERYYGIFGNEINEYKVYVRNREHKEGYFTVKFYLTDYYGKTRTESMTYYLKPHEEKKFVYKNVYNDGREYRYWRYKVIVY